MEHLPGNWYMVVMDNLSADYVNLATFLSDHPGVPYFYFFPGWVPDSVIHRDRCPPFCVEDEAWSHPDLWS